MLDIWQLLFKKTTILYGQNHPFGSENGAGIYFFRFAMQCCQVLVTGRIMADNEAFDTGFQSDVCRLPCCRMECFFGACLVAFGKGRLMIKKVYPFNDRDDGRIVGRIRAIRIPFGGAAGRVSRELGITSPSGVT